MYTNNKPFIVFEGMDCSGKSTQIQLISNWLSQQNIQHVCVREPGSTKIGEDLREILKSSDITNQARLLLFNACRNLLLEKLSHYTDHWILCDRYKASTWAYQHYGSDVSADLLKTLDNMHNHNREPDLTIYLEHTQAYTLQPRDDFEKIARSKIRYGYEQMMNENWLVIQDKSISDTTQTIITELQRRFLPL